MLTVPTIGGESIEEYATRVFEHWKLGQKGKDNGVLVVVVPNDRKMRIEVGYGLEGTLTDVVGQPDHPQRDDAAVQGGNYDGGVSDGVDAIVAQLEGRGDTAPASGAAVGRGRLQVAGADRGPELRRGRCASCSAPSSSGSSASSRSSACMTPGVGWFLYVFLIPFWAMFPIIIVGREGALCCSASTSSAIRSPS